MNRPTTPGMAQPRPSGPLATPSATAPGRAAAPAPATLAPGELPERRAMTTSTVLAWWRVLVIIACLAAAVITPLVLNDNRNSLLTVDAASQQVLRLQSVKGDLLAAEASASQALLLAGDADADDAYLELLASAAKKLTLASAARPVDADGLADTAGAVAAYTVQLSEGMISHDLATMTAASTALHDEVLPKLDNLITVNQNWLELSASDQRWLSALLAVPIALIIAASVIAAHRTRRVLNVGLLVALAVSIAMLVVTTQLVTTSAQSVSVVRDSGVAEISAVGQAYASTADAKSAEGRVLLGITSAATGNEEFTAAIQDVRQMLQRLPQAEVDQVPAMVDQIVDVHDKLMAAPDPTTRATLASQAMEPYEQLVTWLDQHSESVAGNLHRDLNAHANTVQGALGGVAIGMVLAALAAGIGISQPLRRYR